MMLHKEYHFHQRSSMYTLLLLLGPLIASLWILCRGIIGDDFVPLTIYIRNPFEAMVIGGFASLILIGMMLLVTYQAVTRSKTVFITEEKLETHSLFSIQKKQVSYTEIESIELDENVTIQVKLKTNQQLSIDTNGSDEQVEKAKQLIREVKERMT